MVRAKMKSAFLIIIDFFFGFISFKYLLLSWEIVTNTSKGSSDGYYNPEGESLRVLGVLMILIWGGITYYLNKLLKRKLNSSFNLIYQFVIVCIGVIISGVFLKKSL